MKLRKTVTALVTIAAMVIPVYVNAGGTLESYTFTGEAEGCTLRIGMSGGVVTDENNAQVTDGIIGYSGEPVNVKIPQKIELTPENDTNGNLDYAQNVLNVYEDIEIPAIFKDAFKDCETLKTIELTGNSILSGAFNDCDNLEKVVFDIGKYSESTKDIVSNVYENAFVNCKALKEIVVKDNVYFYENAFVNSPVETLVLPEKFESYVKPTPVVREDGTSSVPTDNTYKFPNLKGFTNLKNVNIPYGTYTLTGKFEGCTALENIEIPETVGSLSSTFKNCTSLKEVKILGNETPIAKNTFEGCSNVTVVCNPLSKAAENCKKYGIKAVDFKGNIISGSTETPQSTTSSQETKNDEISVILNGNKLSFTQTPVIENGTTLVPMRAIFEAMGASVEWDGTTQTVISVKDDTTISLTLNKETAIVNGESISLAVPAKLINGNTMVPLRFVSESLGAEVNWDGGSKTITIKG